MVNRFLLKNGKEFVLINTHNSAYDDGSLREAQMNYLKDFLLEEEKMGNYVIVGGDWNQSPPGFQDNYKGHVFDTINLNYISNDFLNESWNWIYDTIEPTNRRVTVPFEQGKCPVTLIDFYLVSSNIEILSIRTIPMEFAYSDHQPVYVEFKF
jgi:endonuclease/exonuclease/phosphatase family metal-dependent hydrolase